MRRFVFKNGSAVIYQIADIFGFRDVTGKVTGLKAFISSIM